MRLSQLMYSMVRRARRPQQSQSGTLPATGFQSAAADTLTATGCRASAGVPSSINCLLSTPLWQLFETSLAMNCTMRSASQRWRLCSATFDHAVVLITALIIIFVLWGSCSFPELLSPACWSCCPLLAREPAPLCGLPGLANRAADIPALSNASLVSRWPPRMVDRMEAFLALASAKQLAPM